MKRIKYTIYTENHPELRPLLCTHLSGYTLVIGEGRWNKVEEQSVVIITYIAEVADVTVYNLCKRILIDCKQDSVYLEKEEIDLKEITK